MSAAWLLRWISVYIHISDYIYKLNNILGYTYIISCCFVAKCIFVIMCKLGLLRGRANRPCDQWVIAPVGTYGIGPSDNRTTWL